MKLVAANLVALKYLLYMTVFHMLFTSIFSFRHQQKLRHIYKKTELWDWQEIRFNEVFLVREARETSLAINGLFLGATPMIVSIFYETVLFAHGWDKPHQWPSGSALKTGGREMPGSISGRTCRPSLSELSSVFSEINVSTD